MLNIKCSCLSPIVLLIFCTVIVQSAKEIKLPQLSETENVLVSPYLLRTGLVQLYLGAQGQSAEELKNGINSLSAGFIQTESELPGENQKVNDVSLKVANRIFLANELNILPEYERSLKEIFNGAVQKLNFADETNSKAAINNYVAYQTNSKITKIVDKIDPFTKMVLINAIYFKGKWKYPFDKAETKKLPFHNAEVDGKTLTTQVDMMSLVGNIAFKTTRCANIISLPYANSDISMVIFLPNGKSPLPNIFQLPKSSNFRTQTKKVPVNVILPKFKFEFTINMIPLLKLVGINEIFVNANFSSMIQSQPNLSVNQILQKSFIEVDEEGTTAAGAQAIQVSLNAGAPPIQKFEVNRPFTFMLVESSTNRIYFGGQVRKLGSA